MADMMTFPDTWEEFEEQYGITDREEVYTNGARLIPLFRVKQWLDHIADRPKGEWIEGKYDLMCSNCENTQEYEKFPYCPYCGAKMADRKTENSSEKPNNYCDDCLYTDTCDSKEFFYACTSKATISKMEQVDKDINVRSKTEPQTEYRRVGQAIDSVTGKVLGETYDVPQTDCPWQNDEYIPTDLASTMLKNRFKEQK